VSLSLLITTGSEEIHSIPGQSWGLTECAWKEVSSSCPHFLHITLSEKSVIHKFLLPPRRPRFEPRSGHVGFIVNKVVLGRVFFECFGFPCQFSFHRLLHIHHHLSSGAGTIVQLVADVPSGLSLTPTQKKTKKKN
jgi:hypothetical protein